jgi:Rrf2 family transcriptional regulator, iron-sulfur cluster assembly transcription factor
MLVRRERAMNAVAIMLDVAFHAGRASTVSTAEIAERTGLARRGIEPLLQALGRAALLESTRGPRGGYRLGKPRGRLTLAEIVEAVASEDAAEEPAGGVLQDAVVAPFWNELNELVRERLARTTLADLLKRAEEAGMAKPQDEPLTYSI